MKTERITLDDMVFENRNKEYGAYFLRSHYQEYLLKALFIGTTSMLLFFFTIYFHLLSKKTDFSLPKIEDGVNINIKDWVEQPPKIEKRSQKSSNLPIVQQKAVLPQVAVADNTRNENIIPDMTQLDDYLIGAEDIAGIPLTDGLGSLTQPDNKNGENEATETPKAPEPEKTFEKAEIDPTFVGGINALYKYLSSQIQYPKAAQRVNLEGKVYVKFVVEKDGSIANVEILRGIGFGCDEEAARVIKNMPKWLPGKQNGQPVRVYYTLPIWFKLD